MNWNNFTFIDLFAGIGGIRLGFESVGGRCVFSSEFDEDACKTYEANFGERPIGDIKKVNEKDIPDFDILLAGFPCQAFSICGLQQGFEDTTRGTLFFDIARIIKEKKPKAFVLENVKNLASHDHGNTLKTILDILRNELGYHVDYKVLNALDFGLPQKRERIIIVGSLTPFVMDWKFEITDEKTLSDILEKNVDKKQKIMSSIICICSSCSVAVATTLSIFACSQLFNLFVLFFCSL